MFTTKKSAYIAIVAATGLLFLIFLFIRIDGLKVAKKNYMAACTETTWGTVTSVYSDSHGPGLMTRESIKYTFTVNGQTIQGEYSAKTFGKRAGSGTYSDRQVIVHYNPNNVYQNFFANHCQQVDKAETSMIIVVIHLFFWLLISICVYFMQRPLWEMDENEEIMNDWWRFKD